MIPKSGFPLAVLDIEVPQRTIDVNVHPQKSEMKFEDESLVFRAVYKAVLDAIRPASDRALGEIAAVVEKPKVHYEMEPMRFVPASQPADTVPPARPEASGMPAERPAPGTIYETVHRLSGETASMSFAEAQAARQNERQIHYSADVHTRQVADPAEPVMKQHPDERSDGRQLDGVIMPIGQVDLTYIIAQDARGLYIIDQHAAHERILFDKFSAMADGIPSQQLLVHQVLTFDRKEAALIGENNALFASLGFHMEPAGELDYRLTEVPADVPVSEAEDVIREILSGLGDMHAATAAEIRQHGLATTACRAAIKAGEELSLRQMQILLEELAHTKFPYTCPHGRPTILKFSSGELAKMFKRTGFGF